jgi:hypothetical protein
MSNFLWSVKAVKSRGKLAVGMNVEVVRQGVMTPPVLRDIKDAFEEKYGIGYSIDNLSDFEIEKL